MADSTRPGEIDNADAARRAKKAASDKQHYRANRERILAQCKEYRERTKEKKRARDRAYYEANKEKIAAWSKSPAGRAVQQRSRKKSAELRESDPLLKEKKRELDRLYSRQYRQRHPGRRKQIQKRYREKNAGKCRESVQKCIAKKPEYYRQLAAQKAKKSRAAFAEKHGATYNTVRRKVDPQFRLLCAVRSRVLVALSRQNARRSNRTLKLVGCTVSELMAHLEARFLPGMSWRNKSAWHIDHIVPVSRFDLRDPEQQAAAFHYTNLQPLWAEDNLRKSDKVPGQNLFEFACAARIAEGDQPRLSGRARNGTRQHSTNQRRRV